MPAAKSSVSFDVGQDPQQAPLQERWPVLGEDVSNEETGQTQAHEREVQGLERVVVHGAHPGEIVEGGTSTCACVVCGQRR